MRESIRSPTALLCNIGVEADYRWAQGRQRSVDKVYVRRRPVRLLHNAFG